MTNQTKLRPNQPRHVLQPLALVGHHMLALWYYFATNKQTDQPNIQLRNQTSNCATKQPTAQPNNQTTNQTTKQPNMTQDPDQHQANPGLSVSLSMAYILLVLACGFAGGVCGLVKSFSDQRYQRYPPHGAFAEEAIYVAMNLARYCILGTAIGIIAPYAFVIALAECVF